MVTRHRRAFRWLARAGVLIVSGLQACAERYTVSPDGVSYLNLSDAWAAGQWAAGINGYWSPLYPALLGLARKIFQPSIAGEAPLLHALNFCVLVVSLVGFEMLLAELRARNRKHDAAAPRKPDQEDPLWWDLLAYGLFAWAALELIGVGASTPDMIVAAAFYLAAALTLRVERTQAAGAFVGLGCALAVVYLAKASIFAVGVVWVLAVAAGFRVRAPWRLRLLAPAAFAVLSGPWIAALSVNKDRFTTGGVGAINYAWQVNRYPTIWTGLPAGSGNPVHAPRVLNVDPLVVEYPGKVGVSYPLFDDPAYWSEGMKPRSDAGKQTRAMVRQLKRYGARLWPLLVGIVVLSMLSAPRSVLLRELWQTGPVTLPLLVLIAGYATVRAEPRYYAAAAVILGAIGFNAFRRAAVPPPARVLTVATIAVTLLNLGWRGRDVVHQVMMVGREAAGEPIPNPQLAITKALSRAGLQRGDRVGVIGSAYDSYWARLSGVRIAAEIPSYASSGYWVGGDSLRAAVESKFWGAGARIIVAGGVVPGSRTKGWAALPVPKYFVRMGPAPATAAQ